MVAADIRVTYVGPRGQTATASRWGVDGLHRRHQWSDTDVPRWRRHQRLADVRQHRLRTTRRLSTGSRLHSPVLVITCCLHGRRWLQWWTDAHICCVQKHSTCCRMNHKIYLLTVRGQPHLMDYKNSSQDSWHGHRMELHRVFHYYLDGERWLATKIDYLTFQGLNFISQTFS